MHESADLAGRRRLRVVYAVFDGRHGSQVREHRLQVLIRHTAMDPPGHNGRKLARFDVAGVHHVEEQFFIIIRNPGRVRRNVGARDIPPQTLHHRSAREVKSRQRLAVLLRCVAVATTRHANEESAALYGRGKVGRRNGSGDWLRDAAN